MIIKDLEPGKSPIADGLREAARQLATGHRLSGQRFEPVLLKRLERHHKRLAEAYRYFAGAAREDLVFSAAAEWILDNFYLIQQAILQVREDLPRSYYRELPRLEPNPEADAPSGYPRVYLIAQELIRHTRGELAPDQIRGYIEAYQDVAPLTMGELWAFPTMLRMASLENLANAVATIAPSEEGEVPAAAPHEAEDRIVATSVTGLRTLGAQDWKEFFESVSRVERTLREDPARVYADMEFETRDRYRKEIERLARGSNLDEESVAREAVLLAGCAVTEVPGRPESVRQATATGTDNHIGFYILRSGRPLLEQRIGYHAGPAERLRNRLREHATGLYLGSIAMITTLLLAAPLLYLSTVGGSRAQLIAAGVLLLVPATTIGASLVNWSVTRMVRPSVLPKMDLRGGIPVEHRGMVVIPALLTDPPEVNALLQQLEGHYLSNADPHLGFALLSDFADAPEESMPGDAPLLELARSAIQALNERYRTAGGEPFYLFHRRRLWNPVEGCWMGLERKRGKLHEFNRLLRGACDTSYDVRIGDLEVLSGVRYVITLDADTVLPDRSAHRLIATLIHPLNRPEFDPGSGALSAGYTVLQPRVEIKPTSANQSQFARTYAGDTGLDLYTRAVSDVYQDLFGDGIFVGKGIYDVDAFERTLAGRVPENALLSHDLFEGIHGRVGLVTDIMLLEDFPPHYLAYMRRAHRWIRGDWQLLPWLLPSVPHDGPGHRRNDLPALARWKIADNLRRSFVAPSLLAWLFAAWLWLPGSAWVWTLIALFTPGVPLLTSLFNRLGQGAGTLGFRILEPPRRETLRWLLALVFLPYHALIALDAILSTLVRLFITRKGLLRWTTAAHTLNLFGPEVRRQLAWNQMGGALLLAGVSGVLVGLRNHAALPVVAPFVMGWLVSPQIAYWISRPVERREPLTESQRCDLRRLACRTWLFFERFVGPEDHWLPPDHFQEAPLGVVAHRTSPTNIGLYLVSSIAAFDLGYVGTSDLTLRLRSVFDTLDRLERYRGHLLNWYDTRSLQPLHPRYTSTVDSGNLAACLIILHRTCLGLGNEPAMRRQRWDGLIDALDLLAQSINKLHAAHSEVETAPVASHLAQMREDAGTVRDDTRRWAATLLRLKGERWQQLDQRLIQLVESHSHTFDAALLRDVRVYAEGVRQHLHRMQRRMSRLLPWLAAFTEPPALFAEPSRRTPGLFETWQTLLDTLSGVPAMAALPETCHEAQRILARLQDLLGDERDAADQGHQAHDWCRQLDERLKTAALTAEGLLGEYRDLAGRADALFQETDFRFLFDEQRQLFHIGYNVDAGGLDANYYDLLASESRIASYIAIARKDVPQSHWMHLGRPLTRLDGQWALVSWSGTMFEYLMPDLWMQSCPRTLLDESTRAVVDYQVKYGRKRNLPWGMSESGYYRFDAGQAYQYRGFGTAGLGFKRGLAEDRVVAPYASLLALARRPRAVMENLALFSKLDMMGRYGLYEAIDFTSARLPAGKKQMPILSYMSHHQGMILISLANYLGNAAMVRRFHDDPRMQGNEFLLQEQVPRDADGQGPPSEEVHDVRPKRPVPSVMPWRVPEDAPLPLVHVLSNGRYGVVVTSAGGGFSFWQDLDLTRWRADSTLDDWGTWIYVQNLDTNALWSVTSQPTGAPVESQETFFGGHSVEFRRRVQGLLCRTEIVVPPDEDIEIRRVTLINDSDSLRRLVVTSYGEPVLASRDDLRHPAFNKLFIESEYLPEWNTLLFRRRPRAEDEQRIYLAHALIFRGGLAGTAHFESSRTRFLGRGGTTRAPGSLTAGQPPVSGATGATLDPIFSVGRTFVLEAHETIEIAFLTSAGRSRQQVLDLMQSYHSWLPIERAFQQARHQGEVELRQLGLGSRQLELIQQLLSALLYPHPALRADPALLAANSKGQPGLWAFGISGDFPILLVRAAHPHELTLLQELLQAHTYWRNRQIKTTLVILNEWDTSYQQDLAEQLRRLFVQTGNEIWLNRHDGIFVLRSDQLPQADRVLLETAARVVLDCGKGTLASQLGRLFEAPIRLPAFTSSLAAGAATEETTPPISRPDDLLYDNEFGGFSADAREYVIYLKPGQWTPAPWINVIANPEFGFLISESGTGFTWAGNSGENRLTPWRNDPVSDGAGEALYLRDEESARIWSPAPLPARAPLPHLIRHGAGYTVIEHQSHGLYQRMRCFAAPDAPIKIVQLRLQNLWQRPRRITATYYADWVLGTTRDATQQFIVPEFDSETGTLLARNPYSIEFGQRVAFLAANKEPHGITADRAEFLGRMGSLSHPAALYRIGLTSSIRAGQDACAALQLHVDLAAGQTEEIYFLLGQGSDRERTLQLIRNYRDPAQVEAAWQATTALWDRVLGAITVRTPDRAMDIMLNRWLLYQALSCRMWGRSALYQSGGAFGYRDQLQDVMALTHALPDTARSHIIEAARHQFEDGDALHWWHPPTGRGVRTRCSDDLLWLPFVAAHYVTATGDTSVLAERAPFLKGDPLKPGESERYGSWSSTSESYTVYEHCRRAIRKGQTAGLHRLPLIGSGDWNDGLNLVGIGGRGESVWLGWFLYATLTRFVPLCDFMADPELAATCRKRARELRKALESKAWDGSWYLRAYYDDHSPLGSAQNRECRIDSVAQSWAVLSGAGDPQRAAQAMQAVAERLVRQESQLVMLFTPPFDRTSRNPGYIKGYPPGIRENGGQYTHAAIWVAWAFVELGQGDRAGELFRLLNPIGHSDQRQGALKYVVEPYVVAADVYSVPPHEGRGGWTWYTGSASWMWRLGVEAILGLRRQGSSLQVNPCIPSQWPGYSVTWRENSAGYHIRVDNPDRVNRGVRHITLDGQQLGGNEIPLVDDGKQHEVVVLMGTA